MKQKDIALIAVVVVISAVLSLVVSHFVFSKPAARQQTAEVVDIITSDFPTPSTKYFNSNSIDPTQLIQIGNNANPDPFKGQH
jgi:hypothetical protein